MIWTPLLLARIEIGSALDIWVDPAKVMSYAGPPLSKARLLGKRFRRNLRSYGLPEMCSVQAQKSCQSLASFTPSTSAWQAPFPVENHPKAAPLADLVNAWPDYKSSRLYQGLRQRLEHSGEVVYRAQLIRCSSELDQLFERRLGPLLMCLGLQGYRYREGDELGSALIGEDGDLIKSDKADHRFFLCRALGIHKVPLRILAIHPEWLHQRRVSMSPWHAQGLCEALAHLVSRYQ